LSKKSLAGTRPMRVYFSPCGLGLGHVGRCYPIAKELEKRGIQTKFSTYLEGLKFLKAENVSVIEAPPVAAQVKPDGTIDFARTAANPGPFIASYILTRQVIAEIEYMKAFKPDVVVSDSRASPIIAAKLLGIPHLCLTNQFQVIIPRRRRFLRLAKLADMISLTFIGKIWTSGLTLIPDFPEPYTISLGNLNIPKSYRKKVRLIGPIINIRPEQLPSKEELKKKLNLDDRPVIFAPISGPVKERAYFTGLLRKFFMEFPEQYQIVMSLGYPNASIDPIQHGNLRIYRWMDNQTRFEYLKACDLVISRAGHGTISQSMYYGKPMILIPTPSHTEQENNARRAVQIGIAKLKEQQQLTKKELLGSIKEIFENGEAHKRAQEVQRDVLKINGLRKAVEIILKMAEGEENVSASQNN